MAGLIEKDLRIIFQRKQTLLLFLLIGAFIAFTSEGSFIIGWLSIIGVTLATGTISYDELDNGMIFLLTLPIDKKTYVKEKYLFSLLISVVAWLISVVLYFGAGFYKGDININMGIVECLTFIPLVFVVLAVMLPIEIKYGSQKSRVILFVVIGFICVSVVIGSKIIESASMSLEAFLSFLGNVPMQTIFGIVVLISIVVLVVSYVICQSIMKKKEV